MTAACPMPLLVAGRCRALGRVRADEDADRAGRCQSAARRRSRRRGAVCTPGGLGAVYSPVVLMLPPLGAAQVMPVGMTPRMVPASARCRPATRPGGVGAMSVTALDKALAGPRPTASPATLKRYAVLLLRFPTVVAVTLPTVAVAPPGKEVIR